MKSLNLLVVDDDNLILQSLRMSLPKQWNLIGVNSPSEIPVGRTFQAALVDIHLTGTLDRSEGLEVIQTLSAAHPQMEVIAMSNDINREIMESALKAGASRFLAKDLCIEEIELTLDKIQTLHDLNQASANGRKGPQWIGSGKASKSIREQIASLTGESGPILIEGESGAGKEVVANLIHSFSDGPLIAVNIASLSESLFESEFFGHLKGSFTGATHNKVGLAEAANGGDLFLDEIEALSLENQVKLLRFLETGEVRKIGAETAQVFRPRVIVATNRPLKELVDEGIFREDLYWRLKGKQITLPPLRNRLEDLEELCLHFFSGDSARKKTLEQDAVAALQKHRWPGNVRELKRVCEQLVVLAPLPIIRAIDVEPLIHLESTGSEGVKSTEIVDNFSAPLDTLVRTFEAKIIKDRLEHLKDIDKVCETLEISRSSLYKKIKDHQIDWSK